MKLVVKLSGKVLEEAALAESLCRQVSELSGQGHQLLLVHGGGKQLTQFCQRQNIAVVQHQGRRVTDRATLEAAKMVFSSINRDLTALLCACGVKAVGISAYDGGLTTARKRPPIPIGADSDQAEFIDFGFVGDIESVDPSLIETLWRGEAVPVICSLCADAEGQILNINADTLASELALAVGADRLVALSDVDGIYRNPADPSTRIPALSLETARHYLASGVFLDGMIPKIQNAVRVVEQGVRSVQILSGLQERALADSLTSQNGTLLYR